jgi:hypothetical protein
MAVFKIFPEKDATIYSEYSNMNTGRDEILEIASYYKGSDRYVNRSVIAFDTAEVNSVINTYISSSNRAATDFSASLRLMLASANEVPTAYRLEAFPVYASTPGTWTAGNGKYGDSPRNSSGVSWDFIDSTGSYSWATVNNVTASYTGSSIGGGTWYTGSGNYDFTYMTQSHTVVSTHDANINITEGIKAHYNGEITNAGFIIKLQDSLEFQTDRQLYLRYFSNNSHTIYPPHLELKWDDFQTDSTLSEVSDPNIVMKIKNNRGKYTDVGRQRFNLHVRPKYPTRTFTTSSVYLTNYYLPTASYWGLRDENTEEMVIDFDTTFTKISRNTTGNYFDIYMEGLEPERYYRVLIKSEIDGSTNVIDENLVFKVVRNG